MSLASRIIAFATLASVLSICAVLITYDTIPLEDTTQGDFDTLIVLGSPADPDGKASVEQRERVLEGAREFRAGRAQHIIVTGGAVHNRWVEAEVMARVAIAAGVPKTAIITETEARNTIQNLYFSHRIMAEQGWASAEVISNPSHLRRAALILDRYRRNFGMKWRTHASPWPPEYNTQRRAIYWTYEAYGTTLLRWFGFHRSKYMPN